MLPVNCGSHSDYQNFVATNLRKFYPNPDAIARSTWDIIERFWTLDLSYTDEFMRDKYSKFGPAPRTPSCMQRSYLLSIDCKITSITDWGAHLKINPLYAILSGFDVGNTPGIGTFYDFFNRLWDSDNSNLSPNVHPVKEKVKKPNTKGAKAASIEKVTVAELLPVLEDTFFRMKSFLPDFKVIKLLLDSAHDAMPIYEYCKRENIAPFIDLNEKRGIKIKYKNDFTIGKDDVPVCKEGRRMNHDGCEPSKHRLKFRCPLASRKYGCSCEHPCSDSKYGRTVHLAMKDNPRLINIPPRDSEEWKSEFNARTSAERSNKREKLDFKLEDGRHRSTKMWYCRLYHIMMLQHLDTWDLPFESTLRKLILEVA